MTLKTKKYPKLNWIYGHNSKRNIQVRKALYLMGVKVNYPFRKK